MNGLAVFNFKLFIINGKPLEFYLDGFKQEDFMRIGNVIEAFGGKLANAFAANTIVFSNRNHKSDLLCDLYDAKFLHDSVIAQKLQDLSAYRITSSAQQDNQSPVFRCTSRNNNNVDSEASNDDEDGSANDSFDIEAAAKRIEAELVSNSVPNKQKFRGSRPCPLRFKSKSVKESRSNRTLRFQNVYTEEEEHRMVQYLIKNNGIQRGRGETVWKDFVADKTLNKNQRTMKALSKHFSTCILRKYQKYTDDPAVLQKFRNMMTNSRFDENEKYYSNAYKRAMIQYVIDKKAYDRAGGADLWKSFLAEKIVDDDKRTAKTLANYFTKRLVKEYQNYTNDPEARQQFEKKLKNKNSFVKRIVHSKSFTKNEDQAIINFLIRSKEIDGGTLPNRIWPECLASSSLLQESHRSPRSLRQRFDKHLVRRYAQFTKDPVAIRKLKRIQAAHSTQQQEEH